MEFNFLYKDGISPSEAQDIAKCLKNISSIPEGTVPLARRMGLKWANLSQIPSDMENDYATDFVEKIEEFEPRVSVQEISFVYDEHGRAVANVVLEKGEDADGQE